MLLTKSVGFYLSQFSSALLLFYNIVNIGRVLWWYFPSTRVLVSHSVSVTGGDCDVAVSTRHCVEAECVNCARCGRQKVHRDGADSG